MKEKFKKIVDSNCKYFLSKIVEESQKQHFLYTDITGFKIFHLVSKEYNEQKWFENYLESYIRDYLINRILTEYFSEIANIEYHLRSDDFKSIFLGFTNKELEDKKKLYYQYYLVINSNKIAIRYSEITDVFFEWVKTCECFDKFYIVDWNDELFDDVTVIDEGMNIYKISIKYFFELISIRDDEYEYLFQELCNIIVEAKNIIGLDSVPNLTNKYLFSFRFELEKIIADSILNITSYEVLNNRKETKKIKDLEERTSRLLKIYDYKKKFVNENFYKIFIGDSDFARCFITSEYLFKVFKNNNRIDYTSIVSGYLKSVEQLTKTVLLALNNKNNIIDTHKVNIDNMMLKEMNNQFKKNYKLLRTYTKKDTDSLIDCLEAYRDECRNGYFHKDTISDFKYVEKIRKNTFIVYLFLLSCLYSNFALYKRQLGVIDDKLERLYFLNYKYAYYDLKINGINYYCVSNDNEFIPKINEYGLFEEDYIVLTYKINSKHISLRVNRNDNFIVMPYKENTPIDLDTIYKL